MKNKHIYALTGVAAVAVVGGTLAYFNQSLTAENVFRTGQFDTVLVEDFKPEDGDNWAPGAKVNKDVEVVNTGDLPVVVRVKFKETWADKATGDVRYAFDTAEDLKEVPMLDSDPNGRGRNKFENVYQTSPKEVSENEDDLKPDGKTGIDVDDSVVYKELVNTDKWLYNEDDGYYYYFEVVPPKAEGEDSAEGEGSAHKTALILDSVTLSENVDMGKYKEEKYYSTKEKQPPVDSEVEGDWEPFFKHDNGNYYTTAEMKAYLEQEGMPGIRHMKSSTKQEPGFPGYSNAEYTLTITAQTVQATQKAVDSVFGPGIAKKYGWNLASEHYATDSNTEIKPEETPEETTEALQP